MLSRYRDQVNQALDQLINHFPENPSKLREATAYALTNGGKRVRPSLSLMLAEALGDGAGVLEAALAIECLHCASLVADDLPCMDDDDLRRDKPSVHKVYGEATALLVSYGLIAEGYRLIADAGKLASARFPKQGAKVGLLALDNAARNSGLPGAVGGQYLDMHPEEASIESLQRVIECKTISLFEISFVFGWLFGGGDPQRLDEVKQLSWHYGMAFQVADDLGDMDQDNAQHKEVNYAVMLGVGCALERVQQELKAYRERLESLNIATPELLAISELIEAKLPASCRA